MVRRERKKVSVREGLKALLKKKSSSTLSSSAASGFFSPKQQSPGASVASPTAPRDSSTTTATTSSSSPLRDRKKKKNLQYPPAKGSEKATPSPPCAVHKKRTTTTVANLGKEAAKDIDAYLEKVHNKKASANATTCTKNNRGQASAAAKGHESTSITAATNATSSTSCCNTTMTGAGPSLLGKDAVSMSMKRRTTEGTDPTVPPADSSRFWNISTGQLKTTSPKLSETSTVNRTGKEDSSLTLATQQTSSSPPLGNLLLSNSNNARAESTMKAEKLSCTDTVEGCLLSPNLTSASWRVATVDADEHVAHRRSSDGKPGRRLSWNKPTATKATPSFNPHTTSEARTTSTGAPSMIECQEVISAAHQMLEEDETMKVSILNMQPQCGIAQACGDVRRATDLVRANEINSTTTNNASNSKQQGSQIDVASSIAEQVILTTPEGVVLLPCGKKVLRQKVSAFVDCNNSEIFRRENSKLVQRIRKQKKVELRPDAVDDSTGFLQDPLKRTAQCRKGKVPTAVCRSPDSKHLDCELEERKAKLDNAPFQKTAVQLRTALESSLPQRILLENTQKPRNTETFSATPNPLDKTLVPRVGTPSTALSLCESEKEEQSSDDIHPCKVFEVLIVKTPDGSETSTLASGADSIGDDTMSESGQRSTEWCQRINKGEERAAPMLTNAAQAMAALGDLDLKVLLQQLKNGDTELLLNKLVQAEKRRKKLEKQIAQAGLAIAEDIDYSEAKLKVEQIAQRMNEIGGSAVVRQDKQEQHRLREEYFKLEQEMEKFNSALLLTDEYQAEQERIEKNWEEDNKGDNFAALKMIRRHMPVNIRCMSEADLANKPSPNGKFLPKVVAKRFLRTNVLKIIRVHPDELEKMHPATLENLRVTGLTLTERRALYCHLQPLGTKWEKNKADKMAERKWTWFRMMKNNFKESLAPYQRHVEHCGPWEKHVGCTLIGQQCPLKADKSVDYSGDYGWPEGDQYEVSTVKRANVDDPGSKAMSEARELAKEKKARERTEVLKLHYKGKLLEATKASGSCEAMDESTDKMEFALESWIQSRLDSHGQETDAETKKQVASFAKELNILKCAVFDLAKRAGIQTYGKKTPNGDGVDTRSSLEASLAEEVRECSQVFFTFILRRMQDLRTKDNRVEKTIEFLQNMFDELHSKNLSLFEKLGSVRQDRSRELKRVDRIEKILKEKGTAKVGADEPQKDLCRPAFQPDCDGKRGGLLAEIMKGPSGKRRLGLLDEINVQGRKHDDHSTHYGPVDTAKGAPERKHGFLDDIGGKGRKNGYNRLRPDPCDTAESAQDRRSGTSRNALFDEIKSRRERRGAP